MTLDPFHATSVLRYHLSRPNSKLIKAAKQVIGYLRKTRDQGMVLNCILEEGAATAAGMNKTSVGSVDASYGKCLSTNSHVSQMVDTSYYSITVAFL